MNGNVVVDLFCGIGGFSHGFINLGFKVLGIDVWDKCLDSHIIGGEVMQHDITTLHKSSLPQGFKNPDILIGSPPCQTFSTVNKHTRQKDDSLIIQFQRLVEELKPKIWIWENVMGSRHVAIGEILDAQNFGVAQRRKRNFVSNIDISNAIMRQYYKPPINIRQSLPKVYGEGILDGYNSTVYSLDSVSPTIRRIPLKWYDGRFGNNIPKTKMRFTGFQQLSIEDHLTLMGFPRNMYLFGTKTEKMIQIGNCVSPMVSLALAKRVSLLS
jgi:site-specific DNA-cytosine methylase